MCKQTTHYIFTPLLSNLLSSCGRNHDEWCLGWQVFFTSLLSFLGVTLQGDLVI